MTQENPLASGAQYTEADYDATGSRECFDLDVCE
jgi:hypothetical protein